MKLQMARQWRAVSCVLGVGGLVLTTVVGTLALSPGTASAARRPICVGTTTQPGVLAGNYRSGVKIEGICTVSGGPAVVHGKLVVTANSALLADYAINDLTGKGSSKLTVIGAVAVRSGGTFILGCEPNFFPCSDDPAASTGGTLSSAGLVRGNIDAQGAQGVIVHDTTIDGEVIENGGGGGVGCAVPTTGAFSLLGNPPYFDYEDSTIHGDVSVTGARTCWMGLARDPISGNLTVSDNKLADPDGIEILANSVSGDLTCLGNSMTWDSSEASFGQTGLYPRTAEPDTVTGTRSGQCVLASPATQGGPPGPGPF
jgi:hypothetical protein